MATVTMCVLCVCVVCGVQELLGSDTSVTWAADQDSMCYIYHEEVPFIYVWETTFACVDYGCRGGGGY